MVLLGTVRIQLGKRLKELDDILGRNPDPGIGHRDFDDITVRGLEVGLLLSGVACSHSNLAVFGGEFDGVGEQVVEDLFEPDGVCGEGGQSVLCVQREDQVLLVGHRLDVGQDGRERFIDIERLRVQVKLPRLDLRQVQQVVRNNEQVSTACQD